MLAARLLECLFLPSCVTVFVLMDCCVVGAPRARCALGLTLLSQLFIELLSYELDGLPTMLETADDVAIRLARSIDFSILVMLAGAIVSAFADPSSMTFIKLPTNLHELVLFDSDQRRQRSQQFAVEREYTESLGSLRNMAQHALED